MSEDKNNYHYGFNFSDPLATRIYQNYLSLYSEHVDIDGIRSIVEENISIKFFDDDQFIKILEEFANKEIFYDGDDFIFIVENNIFKVEYSTRKKYLDVTVNVYSSTYREATKWINNFDKHLSQYKVDIASFTVDWKYKGGSYTTTEYVDDIIHDEAYPVIKDVNKFVSDYIQSPEPILILRGKTGSGKTRLIRSILRDMSQTKEAYESISVSYTMDDNLLMSDGFFVDFLNSRHDVLVLEDLDEYLRSRKEGNNTMSKLLTVSDGIVQTVDKKIIISTNLNTIGEFDEALLRSGRCFANVRFRELNWGEATQLFNKLDSNFDLDKIEHKDYSISDIYELVSGKDIQAETRDEGNHFSGQVGFHN